MRLLPVLTPAEMTDADRRTVDAGTPVEVLMDRAGHAVAWAARQCLGSTYGKRALVICGKGNNGGDGLVAARVLESWGVRVDVFRLETGVDRDRCLRALQRTDVVIDAMYGTGFKGKLEGDAAWFAEQADRCSSLTIAIDIPSGVNGLTGAVGSEGEAGRAGSAVWAQQTVCFAALKPGLVFEPGRSYAGDVRIVDIGVDIGVDGWSAPVGVTYFGTPDSWVWFIPERAPETNKWRSSLLVVGGSEGMTGAPMLVSHAAMRAGAGIVWCAVPGHETAAAASGTEVITKALPAGADGSLSAIGNDIRTNLERFRAVAVGPGLGTETKTREAIHDLVVSVAAPLVLDADGLNAYAGDPAALKERPGPTVITPHDGEYERLLGQPVGEDRVEAARRLADATGCVALLKGSTTVIAEPSGGAQGKGRVALNPTGGPKLASAGTGDVLTGIIGGFLATGADSFPAAVTAAYVHGKAADAAGHTGIVASDLVDALPRVLENPVSQEI